MSSRFITFALLVTFIILVSMNTVQATKGLDLSVFQGDVAQSAWNCLHSNGYEFAIIQALKSNGQVNEYCVHDIQRAKAAGFKYVDIYVFPDFARGVASAGGQIRSAVDYVHSNGQTFGMVWIDIEAPSLWGKCADNIQFLRNMIAAGQNMGVSMGIYASKYQWQSIMCSSTEFSKFPLWYPHYDNSPSFSDFEAFGGWSKPAIKQYTGTTALCGTELDQNYY